MRRLEQRMQGTDVEAEVQGTERHEEGYMPCASRLCSSKRRSAQNRRKHLTCPDE
jgi:hypothetical protein